MLEMRVARKDLVADVVAVEEIIAQHYFLPANLREHVVKLLDYPDLGKIVLITYGGKVCGYAVFIYAYNIELGCATTECLLYYNQSQTIGFMSWLVMVWADFITKKDSRKVLVMPSYLEMKYLHVLLQFSRTKDGLIIIDIEKIKKVA